MSDSDCLAASGRTPVISDIVCYSPWDVVFENLKIRPSLPRVVFVS